MRILHAIASIDPAGGGPVEGLKQLGAVAHSTGHKVEVVSLDRPGSPHLKDFPMDVHSLGRGESKYAFSNRFTPWLRRNASRFDVVVINGIWQYHSFGTWRALHKCSTPYVVFTHGMLDPWFRRTYPLKHAKKWMYWPWGEYRVLRDAAAVMFTCEEERLLARKSFWLYSAKERVINYGTAGPSDNREMQELAFVDRYPALKNKRIVLFMGRIHPKKGCDLALKAFAATLAADPAWHLVIAGPDQVGLKPSLEALATDLGLETRVTWTGMVGGDVKWGMIRSAEVLFLPSHQENFGIVVAEALACGVPVLISNKVNIWREIEQDHAGLVAEDNERGAAKLLRNWELLDLSVREEMRTRARQSFEKRFTIRAASESFFQVIHAI